MKNKEQYLIDISSKDEKKALEAARYMLDSADKDFFIKLTQKTEFLFDFIKENICKRLEKSSDTNNYKNVIKFFDVYSQDFDDIFGIILAKYASEDLTDELFSILEQGTEEQKTYAAKYFSYIPDTIAAELLRKETFSENESLAFNCAQALGKMEDDSSFDSALEKLKSDDEFEKLKAVKFFVAYGKNAPIAEIFEAMRTSAMPENIAGEIPYLTSLVSILNTEHQKNVLITVDNILGGLSEILPLSLVFQFELYELLAELINTNKSENHYHSKIAQILLKALAKFKIICENDEYIFDEDKNTKQELKAILELLENQNEEFWNKQKKSLLKELTHCKHRINSALEVIKDLKLKGASEEVEKLLSNENEIVVCEAISTLKELDALGSIDKESVLNKVKNENIKAIIDSYWS